MVEDQFLDVFKKKIGVNPSESNYEIKGIVLANSATLKPPKSMKK